MCPPPTPLTEKAAKVILPPGELPLVNAELIGKNLLAPVKLMSPPPVEGPLKMTLAVALPATGGVVAMLLVGPMPVVMFAPATSVMFCPVPAPLMAVIWVRPFVAVILPLAMIARDSVTTISPVI